MANSIRYLVFDIESVADAPLVAKLRFPGRVDRAGRGGAAIPGGTDGKIRQ